MSSTKTKDRELSHWGWGYADRFGSLEERLKLGKRLTMGLGFGPLAPAEPVPLAAAQLPKRRITPPKALAKRVNSRRGERARHAHGRAYRDLLRGFKGDFASAPDLVAYPESEEEVRAIFDWASDKGYALIPFGGGTSVVGGVEIEDREAFEGVISLDMSRMDKVLEIDPISRLARIQAGAKGPALEAQLGEKGLTLRHFPQSFEFSTLGGWIATRAGGHFATLYTHIDELVASTRAVTGAGLFESRCLPGSGAGPSPDRLMIGSEGTLGILTEAWMRIRARPRWKATASLLFTDWERAVDATRAIAQSGLYPSNCRLLDWNEALLNQVSLEGKNVLLLGFESDDHPIRHSMERAIEIAQEHRGEISQPPRYFTRSPKKSDRSSDPAESDATSGRWREAFLDAPYLFNSLVSLGVIADTFETATTWDRFEVMHATILRAAKDAMKEACGQGVISTRFTHVYPDGPASYYTFLAPGRAGAELAQWAAIKSAVSEVIMAHGGTITHHHAVGRMHRPWYEKQRPEPFAAALRAAKGVLDPKGILNPGALLSIER